MRRVLIISYHYPPMNAVASYRTKAYTDHFAKNSIHPTVVTHAWNDPEAKKTSKEEGDGFTIIRVPLTKQWHSKLHRTLSRSPLLSKSTTLIYNAIGLFDLHTLDSYYSIKKFLKSHLRKNHYDLVLSIFSPHYQVRLPYELNKQERIPYVIDFRDLWDNEVVSSGYYPSIEKRVRDTLIKFYWKKWLSKASFFTITSERWKAYINEFVDTPGFVVTNGYEDNLPGRIAGVRSLASCFEILFLGSLYPSQDLSLFFMGVKNFLLSTESAKFRVHFLGLNTSRRPGIIEELKSNIASEYLKISHKVRKEELPNYINRASLLFYPAFKTIPGWISAKVYDYIASRKNILVCPGDAGLVDDLVRVTQTGYTASTSEEVTHYIAEQYNHWLHQRAQWSGNEDEIKKYSRHAMSTKMASLIINYTS